MPTKKASAEAPKGYEKLLREASALRSQGGRSAYQRATLLTKVFNDRQFRLDNGNVDDGALAEVLDQYVSDLLSSHPFQLLQALLEYFPDERIWEEGNLKAMVKQMQAAGLGPKREVKRRVKVSRKQYAELEKRFKQEQARVRQLRKEKAELEAELAKANRQLKRLERGRTVAA